MGFKPTKEKIREIPKKNSNGKKIFLTIELCYS